MKLDESKVVLIICIIELYFHKNAYNGSLTIDYPYLIKGINSITYKGYLNGISGCISGKYTYELNYKHYKFNGI